jgi:hypothetical protein
MIDRSGLFGSTILRLRSMLIDRRLVPKSRSTSSWPILACNFSISASLEALAA